MQITFKCPHCRAIVTSSLDPLPETLACDACHGTLRITPGAIGTEGLSRCMTCPSQELFVRKDFPQRLGVAIVVIGFLLSSIAWYYHWIITTFVILFVTALIDVFLYFVMGELVECYQCHSQYRGLPDLEPFDAFDLEVHEKHRQRKARLKKAEG